MADGQNYVINIAQLQRVYMIAKEWQAMPWKLTVNWIKFKSNLNTRYLSAEKI